MAVPPPVPAAGTVIPPPVFNFVAINLKTGMYTVQAISQLTQFWALVSGEAGIVDNITILQGEVSTLFGMHGDATIDGTGLITVVATNGVAFGPFATGTDGADLTADSVPYTKLADAVAAILLGADGAGPITAISIGRGLVLVADTLSQQDPIVAVGALGAPTAGKRAFVNDSTVPAAGNFGAVVAGGAGDFVPCYADGVDWRIG